MCSHLFFFHHVSFAEDLHRIHMAGVDLLDEANLPKGSLPDHLDCLKVVDAQSTSFQSGNQGIIQVSQNSGKSAVPL